MADAYSSPGNPLVCWTACTHTKRQGGGIIDANSVIISYMPGLHAGSKIFSWQRAKEVRRIQVPIR